MSVRASRLQTGRFDRGRDGFEARLPLHLALHARYLNSGTEAILVHVFVAFLISSAAPNENGGREMSDIYKFYAQRMADRRVAPDRSPLRRQLVELPLSRRRVRG